MSAIVTSIHSIEPHPNADRLDVLTLALPHRRFEAYGLTQRLVTGKHYKEGDLGVWLLPGSKIPGWLAHNLWLVGKEKASDKEYTFTVKSISIRGVESFGLWVGQYYQTDTSAESHDHFKELKEHGGTETIRDGQPWITPSYWNPEWKVGNKVDELCTE